MQASQSIEHQNAAYKLSILLDEKQIHVVLTDLMMGFDVANSAYVYQLRCPVEDGARVSVRLVQARIAKYGDTLTIRGQIGDFELEHNFLLPANEPILEERITLHNRGATSVSLEDFSCGFQRVLTSDVGAILSEMGRDRIVAIPFRHKPTDPPDWNNDFDINHLLKFTGVQPVVNELAPLPRGHGYVPTSKHYSEAWSWCRGDYALGIFKFNQAAIEFSVLAVNVDATGVNMQFGGASILPDSSSPVVTVQPGDSLTFGVTRMQTVQGGFEFASYAFRDFLTQQGCCFPADYNPPVHWNEIYDNAEYILGSPGQPPKPRLTRRLTYTRDLILEEAGKAQAYHCEALYLDPGWDTDFATFLWGEKWLGSRKQFVRQIKEQFGLGLSLHCPLAPWLSHDGRGVPSWPSSSYRMDRDGNVIYQESVRGGRVPSVCLGSRQYLDEAEKRLIANCADGVVFLMFDGNWWQSECWDPKHGHAVPYTKETHCLANLELAQRIHKKYPNVLIEMHDMITGGSIMRYSPVYYKYGLPGSYDENWGFELMWQSMEDIRTGKARSLYYYNLACNVPIYLHVDLRADNIQGLVFWWYASTCRHLGIGGTHDNPLIAEVHKQSMKKYRQLERFFKRGEFYGVSEEVHFHALADENAFVVNLFNLSDESRIISGTIAVEQMGLSLDQWYVTPYSHAEGGFNSNAGTFTINRRLEPWSAQVAYIHPLENLKTG